MKFLPLILSLMLLTPACAGPDGQMRHGAPPPGSHSPYSADEIDPAADDHDRPEPEPEEDTEEEEPEPEQER